MSEQFGVAVKAIIKNKEEKFLIIFKSDIEDINPNEIDIPGGRLKFGEEIYSGLKREVLEETNLEIKILKQSRVWSLVKGDLHLVGITFLAELVDGVIRLSNEHDFYKWLPKEEILNGEYPDWIKEEFAEIQN